MKRIHLIGIGGTGISSIARVLLERGYIVSGSDRALSPLALSLKEAGAQVFEGHSAANIQGADLVVRSSAIPDDNVEVAAAHAAGIPVLKRSDFLGQMMEEDTPIAVAGSHGKTTTSDMLAWTLTALDLDPSYILGGVSTNLSSNAHAGRGNYFVIEADEYDHMFLGLNPSVILITNVDYDHPDCFPTPESYIEAFRKFVGRLKPEGLLVTCEDQPRSKSMLQRLSKNQRGVSYGLCASADYQAANLKTNSKGGTTFDVFTRESSSPLATLQLRVPGEHNVLNALGVFAVVHQLGLPVERAKDALAQYIGARRRFEIIGESAGVTVVSDYAHNPSKIKSALSAARQRFPERRLIAVWQPHTYSRTRTLETDFIASLQNSDLVIVTDIYASREKAEAYSSQQIVEKMTTVDARYIPIFDQVVAFLMTTLKPGDVVLVLSAGDADQICDRLLDQLKERKG